MTSAISKHPIFSLQLRLAEDFCQLNQPTSCNDCARTTVLAAYRTTNRPDLGRNATIRGFAAPTPHMNFRLLWLRRGAPSHPHPPGSRWILPLSELGVAAARETLVTATVPFAAVWTDLFREMLTDCFDLRWRENGPGIGRDARIAYSGLLGRYMARAYLTAYEGVRVLVPLDEAKRALRGTPYCIGKLSTGPGLEADWVGLDNRGRLVIAEAKGSFDKAVRNWSAPWRLPDVVHTAIGQAQRTAVWANSPKQQLPAKRWAVAARWANEANNRDPILIAWDPDEGQLDGHDYQALANILHRADVVGVLTGLGHPEAVPILDVPEPTAPIPGEMRLRIGLHTMEPGFAAVVGPVGFHTLRNSDDIDRIRRIRELTPPSRVRIPVQQVCGFHHAGPSRIRRSRTCPRPRLLARRRRSLRAASRLDGCMARCR